MAGTPSLRSDDRTARPEAARQVQLLLLLWWRHMRRRPTRVGAAPKLSGVPTFLLINLISVGYIAPLAWRAVTNSMSADNAFFAWHMVGALLAAGGNGVAKGAASLQVRGTRNDAFLDPLPLRLIARLGLQLIDGVFVALLAAIVPLAGSATYGAHAFAALVAVLLGVLAYIAFFVVGNAAIVSARSLGPPAIARYGGYVGIGLNLVGMVLVMVPSAPELLDARDLAALITRLWLTGGAGSLGLCVAIALVLLAAYEVLRAAERRGFDRVTVQGSAPKALKGAPTRARLEWHMMWRQGGRFLLIAFSAIAIVGGGLLLALATSPRVHLMDVLMPTGLATYLGAIQTIGQAGRAARDDVAARPFLCGLPLAPHQVLDGKARALRTMLIPIFLWLVLILGICAWREQVGLVYRMCLTLLSLYVAVDGAIALAFLSTGVGVVGVGGGQASSSFSTQLLMIPLMTTVLAANAWAASVSFIAVFAVSWEARRAAKLSVRWLDDSDDLIERETTVWRALLAATAFFALQVLSVRLLDLFAVSAGYLLATSFGIGSLVLATLTWRNNARFASPRWTPLHIAYWPLGLLGGATSGFSALRMAVLFPKSIELQMPVFSLGESVAAFVSMVVVAPLAEEYFFRGWLQNAIAKDLPHAYKRWAFAIGACVFALAHVGSYGLPQLVLGMIAGALVAFGGGLWPAILAHAMHNAIVLTGQ